MATRSEARGTRRSDKGIGVAVAHWLKAALASVDTEQQTLGSFESKWAAHQLSMYGKAHCFVTSSSQPGNFKRRIVLQRDA